MDRTHYRPGDEPVFEVKVQNVGSTLLEIPFSPHIADLQPSDPGQKFSVKHLAISWVISSREISHGDAWSAPGVGTVMLYGRRDHPNTMVNLKPGEWVRIVDQGQFELSHEMLELIRSGPPADHIQLDFNGLFREEILVAANRSAIVDHELCLSKSVGQTIPVELSLP